jgi:outer membrane protein assembly factor BamD
VKLVRTSGVALAAVCLLLGGCFGKKKINPQDTQGAPVSDSVAPDKVLYQHSLDDINHGHYEVARLTLQSLINTYPDSEYLAKAKMALGDSYYKEGGNTGLSQAVLEYKDFITFFPFLTDECAYAQMQIGMAHYRRVEKADRDTSEAEASEEEFQVFLQKYPSSTLVPQVEQQLRNVQEILADGDFRIAQFYYTKGSYRASAGRLLEVASRYPLYSESDKALMMLAGIYERNEKTQYAGLFYSRLVRDYPLSPYVGEAKEHLTKLGLPIPAPDPEALARMKKEQQTPRPRTSLLAKAMGPIESRPNMSAAAQSGTPQMNPPDEAADLETLVAGSGFNLSAAGAGANSSSSGSATGSTGAAGGNSGSSANSGTGAPEGTPTTGTSASTPTNGAAVKIVTPGQTPTPGPAANTPAGSAPGSSAATGTNDAATTGAPATETQSTQNANCPPAEGSANSSGSSNTSSSNGSAASGGAQKDASQQGCPAPQTKKKKKHFPW